MLVPALETDEEREERELGEYREREARRRPPRRTGWATGQPHCRACRLFIPTLGALCGCGFDNGLGRYVT